FTEDEIEVTPDQEPYESGKIEPVMVKGQDIQTLYVFLDGTCHVCPNCHWIRDFDGTSEIK
ncbi:hypothetical protein LCGC14_1284600, partial [marine sediment metagenome]